MGRPLEMANTVDHRVSISEGGPAFPGHDGLASYCQSCHSQKTARGAEAGAAKTNRPLQPRKGCDANGNPLDPAHPWNLGCAKTQVGTGLRQNPVKSLRAGPRKTAAPIATQLVFRKRN